MVSPGARGGLGSDLQSQISTPPSHAAAAAPPLACTNMMREDDADAAVVVARTRRGGGVGWGWGGYIKKRAYRTDEWW